jgi:hypothetical protein
MLVDERDNRSLIYTTEATNQVMRLLKDPSWNLNKQLTYRHVEGKDDLHFLKSSRYLLHAR